MGAGEAGHERMGGTAGGEESVCGGGGGADRGMAEIEGDGFIDYFYVHPEWRGRGIGKALLGRVEEEAEKLGVKIIFADVSVTAKEFFLARGFRIVEAKENLILGHSAPNFRMEKQRS